MVDRINKDRVAKIISSGLAGLIHPIAWPGWLIELIVRQRFPDWEFNVYTSTPYFLCLLSLATFGLLSGNSIMMGAAMYVVAAMELLALWICLTYSLGRSGLARRWFRNLGRRRWQIADGEVTLSSASLYGGIVGYVFTIYFFACVEFLVEYVAPNSYAGLKSQNGVHRLWELFYFSVVTIATVGYGDIVPNGVLAQCAVVSEIFLGFFFVVFLFGTFISYRVTQLSSQAKE
jgi:hypothetical protein